MFAPDLDRYTPFIEAFGTSHALNKVLPHHHGVELDTAAPTVEHAWPAVLPDTVFAAKLDPFLNCREGKTCFGRTSRNKSAFAPDIPSLAGVSHIEITLPDEKLINASCLPIHGEGDR